MDLDFELTPDIREFTERDLDQMRLLEKTAFIDYPWKEEDYVIFLRNKRNNHEAYVADWQGHILGFMLVVKNRWNYEIVSIAVSPEFRGKGLGSLLINHLKNKLEPYSREDIYTRVQFANKDAAFFFMAEGFVSLEVEEHCFGEMDTPCYLMKYEMVEMPLKQEYINR